MRPLVAIALAVAVMAIAAPHAAAERADRDPKQYLYDELLELAAAERGSELPGGAAPSCFVEKYRDGLYILDDDGTVLVDEPGGWFEDCSVRCTYHRIDDIDGGNQRWADFVSERNRPELIAASGPIWALVETESFNGLAVLLWYCINPGSDLILNRPAPAPGAQGGGDLRLMAGFPGSPNFEPWYRFIPVEPEITDLVATRARLWAGIPIPNIDVLAAPPLHRDNANYQVSNWVWLDEIEDPLTVVSMHAETVAVMVRARIVFVAWDFGDGSDPVICEAEKLIAWTTDYDLFADADLACSYAYRSEVDGPVTLSADVTFEGQTATITRPGTTFPWPAPVWVDFAETRTVPAVPIEFEVTPILALNVNERQEPTSDSG